MAKMPRLVVPGYPHHVTLRGNRRMKTFFTEADYQAYLDWVREFNPVKAQLCRKAEEWPWSSAQAHRGCDNGVVTVQPMLSRVDDWDQYLRTADEVSETDGISKNLRTGRPLSSGDFIESLEVLTGRDLQLVKRGPNLKIE